MQLPSRRKTPALLPTGGFILVAAADWAVMAEGTGRVGVTELLVGVPFPAVALELLRLRAGDAQARPFALSGATFGAGEALARGLVDEAVPAAELAGRSLAAAQRLTALGPAFNLSVSLPARSQPGIAGRHCPGRLGAHGCGLRRPAA
jgi:enoyl-CoA hydratase/carnithine racemase